MIRPSPIVAPDVGKDPQTQDLVSVLIRTRNRPDLLADAVASVAAQDHPRVEMVVVNDGGEDVAPVLAPFEAAVPIRLITVPHIGRSRAGTTAMEAASGTWFAWLDDDDIFYPDHLSSLVGAVRAAGAKVGYSDAHRIDLALGADGKSWREAGRCVPYSEPFSRLGFFRRPYIHPVTVVHHRECFETCGGFDDGLEVLEDWDLLFRFSRRYDFIHLPRVTAAFRIRDDGSNAVTRLRHLFEETRPRLVARYLHLILPEILGTLDDGLARLHQIRLRLERLEAAVFRDGHQASPEGPGDG